MATFKKLSISGSGGGGAQTIIDVQSLPVIAEGYTLYNNEKNSLPIDGTVAPVNILYAGSKSNVTNPQNYIDSTTNALNLYCVTQAETYTFEDITKIMNLDENDGTQEEIEAALGVTFPVDTHFLVYITDAGTFFPAFLTAMEIGGSAEITDPALATEADKLYLVYIESDNSFDKNVFYRVPGKIEQKASMIVAGETTQVPIINSYDDLPDATTAADGSMYYLLTGFDYTEEYTDQHWIALAKSDNDVNMWVSWMAVISSPMTIKEISHPSQASTSEIVINLCLEEIQHKSELYYYIDGAFRLVPSDDGETFKTRLTTEFGTEPTTLNETDTAVFFTALQTKNITPINQVIFDWVVDGAYNIVGTLSNSYINFDNNTITMIYKNPIYTLTLIGSVDTGTIQGACDYNEPTTSTGGLAKTKVTLEELQANLIEPNMGSVVSIVAKPSEIYNAVGGTVWLNLIGGLLSYTGVITPIYNFGQEVAYSVKVNTTVVGEDGKFIYGGFAITHISTENSIQWVYRYYDETTSAYKTVDVSEYVTDEYFNFYIYK